MKSFTLYVCPGCGERYWTSVNSNAVQVDGILCNECGEHFGVDAGVAIYVFESGLRDKHMCETEILVSRAVSAKNVSCRYCGETIAVERFENVDSYKEFKREQESL